MTRDIDDAAGGACVAGGEGVAPSALATEVPRASGGEAEHGHLEEFRTDPIGLMQRVRDECGDVGWFDLAGRRVVLLTGQVEPGGIAEIGRAQVCTPVKWP